MSDVKQPSFRKFIFIWVGQFLSMLGSNISSFGLSVWLYGETGATTPFAMAFLCSVLPSLLLAPLAGSFADRKNRKAIIMLADTADALLKVALTALLLTGTMQIWMVYPLMFLSSTLGTFQSPAFSASIPMIVPEKHLDRANGMRQLSGAVQNLIAPLIAGALYPIVFVEGLIIIDLCSYLFAIVTIALVAIPQPKIEEKKSERSVLSTAIKDLVHALRYLRGLPQLFANILVFAVVNFIANLSIILVSPMILANYDTTVYSLSQTVTGVSMIIGSLVATVLPAPKNRFAAIYGTLMISGVGLIVGSLSPSWVVICAGIFLFTLFIPYVNSLSQTLMQTLVEDKMLGRVDSATSMLCQMMTPISALIAGPLADNVFGPMMRENGILGGSFVGRIMGTGESRGAAVVFLLSGIALLALTIVFFLRSLKKAPQPEST